MLVRLRLLGSLELHTGQREISVGGARQRIVLSMLALNHDRVTTVEQLIDAVWDTEPPSTARGQIQFCISALRKQFTDAGEPTAITTDHAGYRLSTESIELDSVEFVQLVAASRDLVAEGRLAEAADALRAGLALWRGLALAGVNSDVVQREAALLEDARIAAVEERVRLDLALGRHEELIGELFTLVDEHPLRERRHGFLMLALYRAERQAEALEASRRARGVLVDELGVEPGAELRALETAILNRDPALDLRAASARPDAPEPAVGEEQLIVPRQLPASIADLTGREEQIAEIHRLLGETADPADRCGTEQAVRIVAISGRGGVGKSTIAVRAAHELREAFPDGQLYGEFRWPDEEPASRKVLERFLRALGGSAAVVPDEPQEQVELYRTLLANKRVLVVLDGVTSEEQVKRLLPGSPTCAVITTSRARLSGLCGARRLDVDALDESRSLELLAHVVGARRVREGRESALGLVRFCGGLPLALRIVGARLAAKPHWRIADLVDRLADDSKRLDEFNHRGLELRSNIGITYQDLGARAKRLFRLIALVRAPDFPGWVAAALLDENLTRAEDVLEVLIDARLVDAVDYPGKPTRYRMHDLIWAYARERLFETEPGAERDAVQRRVIGAWLALAEQAHRTEHGGDFNILHGSAPRWWPPGGRTPVDLLADLDAGGGWWEVERTGLVTAVHQAASCGFDDLCWDLALTLVTLFEAKGHFEDWQQTTQVALELAQRAGNRDGEAAMRYSLGLLRMFQHRFAESEQCFSTAMAVFEETGNRHGYALAQGHAALVDGLVGRCSAMLDRLTDALPVMRAVGDRMGEVWILCCLAQFLVDEGELEGGREALESAVVVGSTLRCGRAQGHIAYHFAQLHLSAGDCEAARENFTWVLTVARRLGDRLGEIYALHGLGEVHHRRKDSVAAESVLREVVGLAGQLGERLVTGRSLLGIGEIRLGAGDRDGAMVHFASAAELFAELGASMWQAKALVQLVGARALDGPAAADLSAVRSARLLLNRMDTKEASRWLARLDALDPSLAVE